MLKKGTLLGYVKDHWTFICCVHAAAQQAFFSEFFCEDTLQPDSHWLEHSLRPEKIAANIQQSIPIKPSIDIRDQWQSIYKSRAQNNFQRVSGHDDRPNSF